MIVAVGETRGSVALKSFSGVPARNQNPRPRVHDALALESLFQRTIGFVRNCALAPNEMMLCDQLCQQGQKVSDVSIKWGKSSLAGPP
jgi:hypothetical protein